jgi:hypothetical protein
VAGKGKLAEQVRTRLELTVIENPHFSAAYEESHFLDEKWMGKSLRSHVQEFGVVMALVLSLIATYVTWHQGSIATIFGLLTAAYVMVLLGNRAPAVLHPAWKAWMAMAMAIGAVMTFLLLSLGWFVALMPVAIMLKIAGKKSMDCSVYSGAKSYWEPRDPKNDDFKLLERQF